MPLPNPSMSFTPLDPLPASELNDIVENVEALQDWSAYDNGTLPTLLNVDAFLKGWIPGSGTWTYASATTFTVPADDAARMSVGTKIWLTQTTSKYFYVTGISGTTITVTAGSDYTLANAAITAPYFSNAATPQGFPRVFNFSPSWTGFSANPSGGAGTQFCINGGYVTVHIYYGTATSNSTGFTMTLPITAATRTAAVWRTGLKGVNNGTEVNTAVVEVPAAATSATFYTNYGGAGWTASGIKLATGFFQYEI